MAPTGGRQLVYYNNGDGGFHRVGSEDDEKWSDLLVFQNEVARIF